MTTKQAPAKEVPAKKSPLNLLLDPKAVPAEDVEKHKLALEAEPLQVHATAEEVFGPPGPGLEEQALIALRAGNMGEYRRLVEKHLAQALGSVRGGIVQPE